MHEVFWEIVIVFLLTLLNGFFACSEIALITFRKTRVASLVEEGNSRAELVEQLQRDPESLFATTQIGVSVITIAASAFAGSNLASHLAAFLSSSGVGFLALHSVAISFITVVALVAFVNLIIGELVPKSLGIRYSENFSLLAAYPIWWLSKVSKWLIKFLNFFSKIILKPFGAKAGQKESRLSEEEIRIVIAEGRTAGTIEAQEHTIIENVFEFSDMTVGKIMVPRTQITAFDIDQQPEKIIRQAIDSGYSRIPIYQGNINNVVGILYTKTLLKQLGSNIEAIDLRSLLLLPYFVPNTMKVSEVLQRLQRKKMHMSLVTDEHGEIEGLITLEDILEEIVGEISDETDESNKTIIKLGNNSFLVAGEVSIIDFNKHFESQIPEDQDFTTISGFILDRLGRFPEEGDMVLHETLELLVKEKTRRTVKSIVVTKKDT